MKPEDAHRLYEADAALRAEGLRIQQNMLKGFHRSMVYAVLGVFVCLYAAHFYAVLLFVITYPITALHFREAFQFWRLAHSMDLLLPPLRANE